MAFLQQLSESYYYLDYIDNEMPMNYENVVKQCLETLGDEQPALKMVEPLDPYQLPVSLPGTPNYTLEEAHLNCAISFFPHIGYDPDLFKYLEDFKFHPTISTIHREKTNIITDHIVRYRQKHS